MWAQNKKTTHSSGSRPCYGGGQHTSSHGGHYQGETNSHHKGGHYVNPNSNNRYGVHKPMHALSISDCVGIANLGVAIIAGVLGWFALRVASKTLKEANEDWKQRKWFDLFFKANEVQNALIRYRKTYDPKFGSLERQFAWNSLMALVQESYSVAGVSPQSSVVTSFLQATKMLQPDPWHAPENTCRGGRTAIFRKRNQAQARAGAGGSRGEFKGKVYENGRVAAGPETLRLLASFSERQIRKGTGVRRDTIWAIRHGKV
jgi:hypothetical protein